MARRNGYRALTAVVIALLASLAGVAAAVRSPVQARALSIPRVTRRAPRTAILAGQGAITLVLVTGAGLFTRSLIEALSLNPGVETELRYLAVDENYFSTIGLPIVSGRGPAPSDAAGGFVAVVSASLARLIANGGDALRHRIDDATSFPRIVRGEAPVNL